MKLTVVVVLFSISLAACRPDPRMDSDTMRISLETTIDSLVAPWPDAVVAVSVRDADTGLRLDRNGDHLFHAASTMKVPVMIEVFRLAEDGRLGLDDSLVVRNAFRSIVDGSIFSIEDDSDDGLYGLLETRVSVRDLVHHMITLSSNLATNLIIDTVSADSVQQTSERLGTTHMRTLRGVEDLKAFEAGLSNRTTSNDLATLMEALRDGRAVSATADSEMVSILLEQAFNEMIPSGVPPGTRVAHKTGWITGIDHDAAIVYPRAGAPYVLVILVGGIEDTVTARSLGASITRAVHGLIRPEA